MMRYFFDVWTDSSIQHDFTGRMFVGPEHARELAELLAIDIACSEEEALGYEVQVRDTAGKLLFTVPVVSGERIAA